MCNVVYNIGLASQSAVVYPFGFDQSSPKSERTLQRSYCILCAVKPQDFFFIFPHPFVDVFVKYFWKIL